MRSKIILFILFGFLSSFNLWGQVLNVTLVKKESCSSSSNGSFTITVDNTTTTVGPYAYTIFGVNTSTFKTGSLTLGVPTDIPNLPVDANYIVAVSDGDNAVSNYSSIQSISSVATISGLVSNKIDNSDQTCLTPNGSITISSVTGGSGSYGFAWTAPGFTSSSQNISNLKGGSYTVVVTDLNANCTFTSSPFVITDPLPSTFTISSPDVFLCNGEDLVIDIHPSTPTNGIQYTLYDGATAVGTTITWPTSQIVLVGGLTPSGLHNNIRVEGKLTGSICTPIFSTNTLAVQVNVPPASATLTLAGSTPICEGTSSSIQANITGGSAPYSFTITGLGPVSGYNGSPISVSPVVTTTYSFGSVITDNNGCTVTGTGSFQIVVNPKPTATISGGGPVCASDPLPNVTFTFIGTAPFDFTYTDGTTPVSITGHNSLTYTIPTAPVGTYSITALKDANTCIATNLGTPVPVSVNPLPTASTSGGATVCANALPTITFTFTGIAPFNFTYTDGATPVSVTAHNSSTYTISNAPAGTYSVTALTDANGCIATSFGTAQTVIVNPLPAATISGGGTVCASDPSPSVTFTFTGTTPFNFTYTDGVTPVTITGYGSNSFPINNAPAGTYSITALSDANTCIATALGTPVVVSINPLPTASTSGGATVCANALPTITFTFTGVAPFDFTYTDGTTTQSVISYNSTTYTIPNAPAGTYSVTDLTDVNGCIGASFGSAQTVIVNPLPAAVITGGGIVCSGTPQPDVTFTFTGTAPFNFTYTDGTTPVSITAYNSTTFTIPTAPVGTYSITALSDANTCIATSFGTPVNVSNQVLPTASVSGGGTVCASAPLPTVTFTFTGTAPFNFTYTDGVTPVTVTGYGSNSFPINNAPAGSYSITALSDANCTGTSFGSSANVIVNPSPDVVISGGGAVCTGSPQPNVTFTFTGTAPFNFTYNDGTNPPVSVVAHPTNVFTINTAAVGTYTITALTDATSCPAITFGTPVSVSNQVLPTASVSGGGTVCTSAPLPIVTFTFTGTAPFNFTYTDGATPVIVTGYGSNSFPINNAPAGSYSITALSDANCTGTSFGSSVNVIVNPSPDVAINGGGVVCPGNPQPDVTFVFTGTAPFNFTYNDGTNPPVSVVAHPTNVFTIGAAVVGTYTITAFNDATSCPAISLGTPVSVSNQVLPTASVSGGGTVCTSAPLPVVTFTFIGTAPFDFTYTDGATPVTVTGYGSNSFPINNAPAGSYSITALSDANCTGTSFGSSVDVIVNPSPDVVISGGGIVCAGTPQPDVTFTFTGTAPFNFTYNDGTNPPVSVVAHPTNVFTISAAAVGTYTITAFNDATSCSAISLGTPVSVSSQVLPTASVSGGGTVCTSGPLPTVTFTFTGTTPFNFTYTDGVTPVTITGYGSNSFPINNAPAGSYSITALNDANCTGTSFGSPVSVIVNSSPVAPSITFDATPVCIGSAITAPVVNAPVVTSTYTWYSDVALTTVLTTGATPTNAQLGFSTATANTTTVYVTETTTCQGAATSVTLSVSDVPTALLSGNASVCEGTPATLTIALTGIGPWNVSYSDGSTTFPLPTITASPYTFQVTPLVNTTYNLVSVTNSACGAGTVSGTPGVAVFPINGDQVTFGADTWIGYVYSDVGATAPPVSNINFATSKYRGYIDETDIASLGTSSYSPGSDVFDLNVGSAIPISGPNVCGSYNENYSIRFKMTKVFAAGEYRFTLGGDDGVRLFIVTGGVPTQVTLSPNGSFNAHSYTTYTSGITCLSGSQDLIIEYYEQSGFSRVSFNYTYAVPLVDAIAPASACVNQTPAPTLTANSTTLGVTVTGYNWYTDATLLNKVATTAAYTPSAIELDLTTANTTTFYATASYSCGEGPATAVVVNVINSVNAALIVAPTIDPVCSGGTSDIKITASEAGVSYQLINDSDNSLVGSAVVGTGGDINLSTGALTTTTTFRISASAGTCSTVLTTKPTVNVSGTINAGLLISPTGTNTHICEGTGVDVQVFNSENGVTYQLRDDADDSLIGAAVAGTGGTILLPTGNLSIPPLPSQSYTFNVLASNGTCSIELTMVTGIKIDAIPDISLAVDSDVTGTLCVGGSADITVDLSETGVSYQLRDDSDDSLIGSAVVGNGAKINLPTGALGATTTFNVLATNGACTPVELTATKTINVAGSVALNLSVTSVDAIVCTGSATTIEIANSEVGVTYQLRNDADDSLIGAAVAGTGSTTVPLSLPTGNLTTLPSITFNVLASSVTCSAELTNKATVTVGTNPDATLTVTVPSATLCVNGSTSVTIQASQTGVNYQLRNDADDSLIGSAVAGNGANINLPTGSLAATTTFNVLATSGACTPVELNATATVNVGGTIADNLGVTANASSICSGTATTIDVAGSDATVTYQLRDNATNALIGSALAGNGAILNLPTGNLTATTTFNVLASNGTCSIQLIATASVTITAAPDSTLGVTAQNPTLCTTNTGTNIRVSNSESGVPYQLRDGTTNIGAPVTGTGATIDLPTGNLAATTTLNVFAGSGTCSVQLATTVTVTVSTPAINLGVTAQSGTLCTTNTGTNIRVANSESGVSYQLRDGATNIGTPVTGTGATIDLPTGTLSATTTFNVFASVGTCSAQLTAMATVTVTSTPDISLGVTAQNPLVCTTNTGSNIRVANSQTGASYQLRDGATNVGAPVNGTGGTIDLPTGTLAATTTFNVFASLGATCSAQLTATATVTVTSGPDISLAVTAQSASICSNTGTNIKVTNSENGASYQLRNGTTNVGTPVTGTGGDINLSTGSLTANTTFNVFVTIGTCSAQLSATAAVSILPSTDPSCSGGPGTGNCATVVITPVPTAAQCTLSNGAINFTITPAVPVVNNTGVKITITGISTTNSTIARTNFNNPSFPALPIGVYNYSIEYGDASCLKTGQVTIDQSGTVGTPSASNVVGPKCAGTSTGAVTLDIPGETGNVLEWSLDGVLWNSFTAGNQITGIPAGAAPSFQRVISVRRNSTDPCNAGVTITIQDQFTQITATINPQTVATCNNNDGSVLVAYSGGDATGSGYTFELDGNPFIMPTDNIIKNLSGGNHILKVIDNSLCSLTLSGTQFAVASPGLVLFNSSIADSPSCSGNGKDGKITVTFPANQNNEVAITQDADRSTPVFKDVPANGVVEFLNLSQGNYYVTVKSKTSGCPNELAIPITGGPFSVSFTQEMTCELGNPVVKLSDINALNAPFIIRITKLGAVTSKDIALSQIPAGGIYYIREPELPSDIGEYEIMIVQDQQLTSPTRTCTVSSTISRYTNRGSLTVNAANILPSYSDIATGSFTLTNFAGGTVPYYSSIRFDSASNPVNEVGFETDMEEVDSDPSTFGYIKKYNKLHAGRYHVTVNEEGGCSVEFDVRVPLDFTFSVNNIPNVFTPNGDGVNDFFFVRNLPAGSQLIISNRWGNEVYSSKSYQNDWNGGSAADGIYYYRLKVEGESAVTGWIEIQRGK